MTNYERLLDLPLREVLKDFDCEDLSIECAAEMFSIIMCCPDGSGHPNTKPCELCNDVNGGCSSVCLKWLGSESAPDANYNDQCWLDADVEVPPSGDTTERYLAVICGANQPTLLAYDGDNFIDPDMDDYITYKVRYWRPLPELPQNKPTE